MREETIARESRELTRNMNVASGALALQPRTLNEVGCKNLRKLRKLSHIVALRIKKTEAIRSNWSSVRSYASSIMSWLLFCVFWRDSRAEEKRRGGAALQNIRGIGVIRGYLDFGARDATIFSKRWSPRNGSQNGRSFN
jgi:hypothetical protein